MGNLYSVSKALERLGQSFFVSGKANDLKKANGLILPGVGAFKDAMANLAEAGLIDFLKAQVSEGKPLLGICLGMQLLFTESEENGTAKGFDFLPGRVERFFGVSVTGEKYKVPHMGWNKLSFLQPNHPLLRQVKEDYVYFVHSYVVQAEEEKDVLAACDYFGRVPAIVGRNHIFGMQFHPEKSGKLGMALLKNYCDTVESAVKS